jgi:hypothetical protein
LAERFTNFGGRHSLHFSISFLIQHCDAGVNEWLTIRNLHFDIFRWLPISRYGRGRGSLLSPSGPGVMRVIKGNIGAIGRFSSPLDFSSQGRGSKEDARSSSIERRISPFLPGGSLPHRDHLYSRSEIPL